MTGTVAVSTVTTGSQASLVMAARSSRCCGRVAVTNAFHDAPKSGVEWRLLMSQTQLARRMSADSREQHSASPSICH